MAVARVRLAGIYGRVELRSVVVELRTMSRVRVWRLARCGIHLVSAWFLAISLSLLFTTRSAHQDVASLLIGSDDPSARGRMALVAAPAGSDHPRSYAFHHANSATTVQMGYRRPGAGIIPVSGMPAGLTNTVGGTKPADMPNRINRGRKGDRLTTMAQAALSGDVISGSIYEMPSMLASNGKAAMPRVAFVKPKKNLTNAMRLARANAGKPMDLTARVRNAYLVSASLASAYAPSVTESKDSPFALLLGNRSETETIRTAARSKSDKHFAGKALPASVLLASQRKCLSEAVYFEARSEPWRGQVAVAQVVLNRVKSKHYPGSICGVVYQNKHRRNRCQFSYACDGKRDRIRDKKSWEVATKIAREVIAGQHWQTDVGSATHYHANYVSPRWARSLKRQKQIGRHIFYKFRWAA